MPPKKTVVPDPKADAARRVDNIYRALLSFSPLTPEHAAALSRRGLSVEDVRGLGYGSLPIRRTELCQRLESSFKTLQGVPGFWMNERGGWELAGKSGILIPIRNREGLIVGMKVRVDKPSSASQKYLLLSSNPKQEGEGGKSKYPSGTAAQVLPHWPADRPTKIKVLRWTEGEVKADIATTMTPEYTMSIPGVALWRLAVELSREIKPEEIRLAFDSDKSKPVNLEDQANPAYGHDKDEEGNSAWSTGLGKDDYVVGKSLASLYLALKEAGLNVVIEDWPESAGKGIDDVLVAGATDLIRIMPDEEAAAFCRDMLTAELPDDWVYVIGTKRFIHRGTLLELDKEQYADRFCHETKGNPALKALSNPAFPKVDLPIYMPAREQLYSEAGRRYFNLWRGTGLEEAKGGVKPFDDHCAYILPDAKERSMLLDFLAWCVQRPGEKIHWAIMLQGEEGTGKSYFGTLMRILLGPANVSSPTNDNVHEVYTAWQKSAQLIVIEELMARGRLDLMNKLKPMITQPITIVREMMKPAYEQPNVFNFLMFTNHEDAILLDKGDRRYCVLFSPAKPQAPTYYRALFSWTVAHAGAILRVLRERDLSEFEAKGHAPMTAGKRAVILGSAAPLQQWMLDCLESDLWPFQGDLVSATHLLECLPGALRGSSLQAIGKALKAIGAQPLGQFPLENGAKVRILSTRRHEVWASAGREAVRVEYEKWGATGQPGGNPLLEARPV